VIVEYGGVTFEMTTLNAAELGTPREFRITFPAEHTEVVRWGLARTLGADVVTLDPDVATFEADGAWRRPVERIARS
jgi:hypothetical protein